jgi:tRNA/rRNA methyltransferase
MDDGLPPETALNRSNVRIVLTRPRFPENIGSAARAMHNMGFEHLVVVEPEKYDLERVLTLATHEAAAIVERIVVTDTLAEAVADCGHVVGTSARLGRQRQVISSPAKLAQNLIPIAEANQVAIVFGPEDRGLTNEELRLCHALLNISTADFASINLAQAVMLVCYELHRATLSEGRSAKPRLAERHELDGMYDTLKDILLRIDYIKPDNPDYWMNRIRQFGNRMQLRAKEVSIIRGICRQINWYAGKCYRDGLVVGEGKKGSEDSWG